MLLETSALISIVSCLKNIFSTGNKALVRDAALHLNDSITLTRLYIRDKRAGKFEGIDQERADEISASWTTTAVLLGPIDPDLANVCMRKVLLWNYPDNQPRDVIVQEGLTLARLQEELRSLINMK